MIRSLDQQLRDAREQTESGFLCAHIDTCLPDYLGDHHNRDGELLLGVHVDGMTTVGEVRNMLLGEFDCIAWDMAGESPAYDHDKARASIKELFADVHPMTLDRTPFDASLDAPNEEEDDFTDTCQAWFLISWDLPDEDD